MRRYRLSWNLLILAVISVFLAPTLASAGPLAPPVAAPETRVHTLVGGPYVFEGKAGDAARFTFDFPDRVYGVLFDPEGRPYDIRSIRSDHVPFVLSRDGIWTFELQYYDGIYWPRSPSGGLPVPYTAEVWHPEHVAAHSERGRSAAFEMSWESSEVFGMLGVTVPENEAALPGYLLVVEREVNGRYRRTSVTHTSEGVGHGVSTPAHQLSLDDALHVIPLGTATRYVFPFQLSSITSGQYRASVVSPGADAHIDMAFMVSRDFQNAQSTGSDAVTWTDQDVARKGGMATPVHSDTPAADLNLNVSERFLGRFSASETTGWVDVPQGWRIPVARNKGYTIDAESSGLWRFHIDERDVTGTPHAYFLYGAHLPDFGIYR